MYLDTDILLSLIKKEDWIKPYVDLKKIQNPKTSVFAIIEAELVVSREYGRKDALKVMDNISKNKIKVVNFTEEILRKSIEFMEEYEKLNIFDSVHAAFSFVLKEKIISTDSVFDSLKEIEKIDPRDMK